MGNVTLPTPVFLAGGAFCLLAGYLTGAVVGPDNEHGQTATVVSFETGTAKLCLQGDAVKDEPGVKDGLLCGTWSHSTGSVTPHKGDTFRFVTMDTSRVKGSRPRDTTVIYGTVVGD
ncbi:hypothetical protein ACVW00_002216 [Marmoricola sp. URHA0025 HA25]